MKTSLALVHFASVAAVPHVRPSPLTALQTDASMHQDPPARWTDTAFYVVLVLLVVAIGGLIFKIVKGPPRPASFKEVIDAKAELNRQHQELAEAEKNLGKEPDLETGETGAAAAADEEPEGPQVDYEAALRTFAQAVAQTVGPKIAKGQAVKNILETRVETLTKQTKSFVIDELHGTAGAVLNELGAEEAMLLLDPAKALEGNFPPLPVILAGLFSPVVLGVTALNHVAQALLHFLPVLCLCIASLYIDQGQVCDIPTIHYWLYAHAVMAGVLFLCHICQVIKVLASRRYLAQEMEAQSDELKELAKKKTHELSEARDMFIKACVIVQKALKQEDSVRRSFFNKLIGAGTLIWLFLTVWTFVVVLGWTLVPGTIAFHHSAHEVAAGDFCGAWFTVFTARLCCIIGVLFLLVNTMTVSQWFSDSLKFNPAYADEVIKQAKKIDDGAGGIPVVQTIVKAFVLRGSSETLELQISTANMEKRTIEKEYAAIQSELASVTSQLEYAKSNHEYLRGEAEKLGPRSFVSIDLPQPATTDLAVAASSGPSMSETAAAKFDEVSQQAAAKGAEISKQVNETLEAGKAQMDEKLDEFKKGLAEIDVEAKKKMALELAEKTKEELKRMVEEIMKKLEEIRNSESFQNAKAQMEERAAELAKKAAEAAKQAAESDLGKAALAGDTEALKKAAGEAAADVQQKVGEGIEAGKQAAGEAYDAVKDMDAEQVKAKAAELGEKAQAAAAEGVEQAKVVGAQAAEQAQVVGAQAAEQAKVVGEQVVEQGKVVGEQVAEQAQIVGEQAKAAGEQAVEQAKAKTKKSSKKK